MESKGRTLSEFVIELFDNYDFSFIVRCENCIHNGSYDTDCPIDWPGKEYCSFGERGNEDDD